MITKIGILVLVYFGVCLIFIASLGLFKMPDLYTRMSAVTKAVTFKVGVVLLSVAIYFNTLPVVLKSVVIVLLLFLTTPVSSHLLGREGHRRKTPLWKNSITDELSKSEEEESDEEAEESK